MTERDLTKVAEREAAGKRAHDLIAELYPICRSITGDGLRRTLGILGRRIPLQIREVATGTKVFDWVVPKEWNIRDAYLKDASGVKVVDFKKSNLHVVSYSVPVRKTLTLAELKKHLFTLPGYPDWIPYKTSYYKENWGFCLTHNQLLGLRDCTYEAVIDATLEDGHLSYGELYLPGTHEEEVLISCHACHPSLCNDNLSGLSIATLLAERIMSADRRYSYRFLFIPGTIGAITWLSLNREIALKIRHGLVLTGLGDPGKMVYKKSRRGDALIDRAVAHVLGHSGTEHTIVDFSPYGYDERQYCSPGFNLPVGRLSRTPFGEYPEYHNSADNLDFVKPWALGESFVRLCEMVHLLENDGRFMNLNPYCELQLGKRGLYERINGDTISLLWLLNLSDGSQSLLDIAERSGLAFSTILQAKDVLIRNKLLQEMEALP